MNQRKIALNILYKTINDSSYSNLLMRQELNKVDLINRPFITNLVNGVLKNYETLLYNVNNNINNGSNKNKLILMMALYELFYLNKEAYAVVNEYVKLADSQYTKGFINSILRKIDKLDIPNESYIKYNLPKWIYDLLSKQYSEEDLITILDNYQRIPKIYYHINSNKADINDLKNIHKINNKIFTSDINLINSEDFNNGKYYIQDINASTLIEQLELKPDDKFIDICSAPGSKLFNALDYIKEENAYANDLHKNRVKLIESKAKILGYENINYLNIDATKIDKYLNIKFDKILLDVPCSGLGVIGRKPDIKFHIKPESLDELQVIQKEILESSSILLKNGGLMLYSTCTLNKKENRKQVDSFIANHEEFEIINDNTIINIDGDMFYHCLIKKV